MSLVIGYKKDRDQVLKSLVCNKLVYQADVSRTIGYRDNKNWNWSSHNLVDEKTRNQKDMHTKLNVRIEVWMLYFSGSHHANSIMI